ncbi:MAG: PP2C family protein-serine/threonine phosphatase [Candidatus Binataceae bacterium]
MTTSFTGTDGFSYAPGNAQALGRRADQQDAFGFSDPSDRGFMDHGGLLAVVADGMGGLERGAEASQIAVRRLIEVYTGKPREESVAEALRRAADAADRAVFNFAAAAGLERDVGSTVIAAALGPRGLAWISVGDSALYLCRNASITLLTHPHTLAARLERLVERGELSPEAARIDPDRDGLTSYIGAGSLTEIDASTKPIALMAGDAVVLCTDGLFRALTPNEIAEAAAAAVDGQAACDALLARALARNLPRQDNVTVLCVKVARTDH